MKRLNSPVLPVLSTLRWRLWGGGVDDGPPPRPHEHGCRPQEHEGTQRHHCILDAGQDLQVPDEQPIQQLQQIVVQRCTLTKKD